MKPERMEISLVSLSATGDDKNLASHGNDRSYWYSVRDVMTLLINIRKEGFTYHNTPDAILGEEYFSLRENNQKLLVTDPYHVINFDSYLSDDIDRILGNDERAQYVWRHMPNQIIIPLLAGLHWRVIRIEIDYAEKKINILWDDPYGKDAFSDQLKQNLLPSVATNIGRLIAKKFNLQEYVISEDSIIEINKLVDQQGRGENSWDCGPIIVSNIRDYVKNSSTGNDVFYQYSISRYVDKITHEQIITNIRTDHVEQYSQLSGITIDNARLDEISNSANLFLSYNKIDLSSYEKTASNLTPTKINMLFAILENYRLAMDIVPADPYTEEEIKYGLEYIDQNIVPILLEFHYDQEVLDINEVNALLKKEKSNFNNLRFASDTNDFVETIKSGVEFVDKTMFIKEIVESDDKVLIITRPRRWGKTTNLDIVKSFLSIEVDRHGNLAPVNSNKILFGNLKIGEEIEFVTNYQGNFPVIFFTFKDIKADNYDEIESLLRLEIRYLYEQFKYLMHSSTLDIPQKNFFDKYLRSDITSAEIKDSIKYLSNLLEQHHNIKTYLLIDEYDTPLNSAYSTDHYDQVLKLMKSMLGKALKGNKSIEKAVVTGITKIAKAGLFSDINNVREYSILDEKYAQYFGFTEAEVEDLLNKAAMIDPIIRNGVKEWYNGYQIGNYIIYNPWSIALFFDDKIIKPYWVNTESMISSDRRFSSDLLVSDTMQEEVRELIIKCREGNKQTIEITINPEVTFLNLKNDPTAAWTMLAYSGYLSLSANEYKGHGSSLAYQARIPNKEVLAIYEDSISLWLKEKLRANRLELDSLLANFDIEDSNKLQEVTKQILAKRIDIIGEENESLFHSLIEGLYLLKGSSHRLSSEKISGLGKIDSIFYPIEGRSNKIIIQEYKILGKTDAKQIDKKLEDALWQIYEKQYLQEVLTKFDYFHYHHYQNVEIRAVVAFVDENNHQLSTDIVSMFYKIADCQKLLQFFKEIAHDRLEDLKLSVSIHDLSKIVLENKDMETVLDILTASSVIIPKNIGAGALPASTLIEFGNVIGNKNLAKELITQYGDTLFDMGVGELSKLKGVKSKRAEAIVEYADRYKKAKVEASTNEEKENNDEDTDIIVEAVFDIRYQNSILNHKEFPTMLKFAKEKAGSIAIMELMNLKNIKNLGIDSIESVGDVEKFIVKMVERNFFLNNEKGKNFIEIVANNYSDKIFLSLLSLGRDVDTTEQPLFTTKAQRIEIIGTLIDLCENPEISEQILQALDELGIEKVLEIFFGDKIKSSDQDATQIQIQEQIALTKAQEDDQLLETIAKIEAVIGKEALAELVGWHQYISKSLSNNYLSKHATTVIQTIGNLVNNLDKWLDFSSAYESVDINDQVTIILTQLENMFDFVASGITYVSLPPRYPDFDPDDYYGGGSGGESEDSLDANNINNEHDFSMFIYGQSNSTMFD